MHPEVETELREEELRMQKQEKLLKAQLISLGMEIHRTKQKLLKADLSNGARRLMELKLGALQTKYSELYHLLTD